MTKVDPGSRIPCELRVELNALCIHGIKESCHANNIPKIYVQHMYIYWVSSLNYRPTSWALWQASTESFPVYVWINHLLVPPAELQCMYNHDGKPTLRQHVPPPPQIQGLAQNWQISTASAIDTLVLHKSLDINSSEGIHPPRYGHHCVCRCSSTWQCQAINS